jgi:hypothetical protein
MLYYVLSNLIFLYFSGYLLDINRVRCPIHRLWGLVDYGVDCLMTSLVNATLHERLRLRVFFFRESMPPKLVKISELNLSSQ